MPFFSFVDTSPPPIPQRSERRNHDYSAAFGDLIHYYDANGNSRYRRADLDYCQPSRRDRAYTYKARPSTSHNYGQTSGWYDAPVKRSKTTRQPRFRENFDVERYSWMPDSNMFDAVYNAERGRREYVATEKKKKKRRGFWSFLVGR